jgi:hypothetical protein
MKIDDCSKKEKKAVVGLLFLISIVAVPSFKQYINIGIVYLIFAFIVSFSLLFPYLRCLMEYNNKTKPPSVKR